MRATPVLALLAVAAAPGVASAQEQRTTRPTPVAAHGAVVAWSAAEGTRFRLVTRTGGGPVVVAPILPRSVPFDVDLGPSADGTGVDAVFSRCRREAAGVGGFLPHDYDEGSVCDLFRLDLDTGRERRIVSTAAPGADETWPTIWRGTVAFSRTYGRRPDLPYVYVQRPGQRSVRLPGGPRNVCSGGSCTDRSRNRPYALELRGERLAFGWAFAGRGEGLTTELRLDSTRRRGPHARLARAEGGGLTGHAIGWPAFDGADGLYASEACFGEQSGCAPELRRVDLATGETTTARAPRPILAHERIGVRTLLLVDEQPGADCLGDPPVPGGTCVLRELRPVFAPDAG